LNCFIKSVPFSSSSMHVCHQSQSSRSLSPHVTGFLSWCQCCPDSGITLTALSEESLAQVSVQAPSQPSLDGWQRKLSLSKYLVYTRISMQHLS